MTPAFSTTPAPDFSLPTFDQVLLVEKYAIVRLAKKFRLAGEQIQAAAWLAHQRAAAEAKNENDFLSVFFAKLKAEFWEEKGGRRSAPAVSAHWKNDDGEFCEVEFSDENLAAEAVRRAEMLAEIDELRSRLTAGQLEILEMLAEGPAAIGRRFNVTQRRGQQLHKEIFEKLKKELGGDGEQPSLW